MYLSAAEIKQIRDDLDLTQKEIAEQIGVNIKAYRNWEKGITSPRAASRRKLRQLIATVRAGKVI